MSDEQVASVADGEVDTDTVSNAEQRRSLRPTRSPTIRVSERPAKRHKTTGGLRPSSGAQTVPQDSGKARQLHSAKYYPQRSQRSLEGFTLQPSTLNDFVEGIWARIFEKSSFDFNEVRFSSASRSPRLRPLLTQSQTRTLQMIPSTDDRILSPQTGIVGRGALGRHADFGRMSILCRDVMRMNQCSRALELIIQAHWCDCFDDRVKALIQERSDLSAARCRVLALKEACEAFDQSEKVLRNKT